MPPKVAIVHYHLRAGGVTRVIENTVAALARRNIHAVVLHGEPTSTTSLSQAQYVQGLGYTENSAIPDPQELCQALLQSARARLGGPPTLWHFHNHSLGKNPALPAACHFLAQNGHRLLLQMHDFPEDGRPDNYRNLFIFLNKWDQNPAKIPYPTAPQINYTVLNPRDAAILSAAGLPQQQLHILPNPVSLPQAKIKGEKKTLQAFQGKRLTLYPTRGVRRKNLGELLLWATLAEKDESFATTLTPQNPIWRSCHNRWAQFSRQLGLPVQFGLIESHGGSFPQWLESAQRLITTSVAEGFGMAFLEPSLLSKPLVGRNLPEITADFGINLSNLYQRLEIPLPWVGRRRLRERLQSAIENFYPAYGRNPPEQALERAFNEIVKKDRVDFGRLDEPLQEKVIKALLKNPQLRAEIRPSNLGRGPAENSLHQNKQFIIENYSLESYGVRLEILYRNLLEQPIEKINHLDPQKLLAGFLAPESFSLLRN